MKRMTRLFGVALCLLAVACGRQGAGPAGSHPDHGAAGAAPGHSEGWAVTAWGDRYEIFAEAPALVAGRPAAANTHVTRMVDFAPVSEATVTAILRSPRNEDQLSQVGSPIRPGIFKIELPTGQQGEFELFFLIDAGESREEIPGGKVRVGTTDSPGSLVTSPATSVGPGFQVTSFLKEQQWRTKFATAVAGTGTLQHTVKGTGRVTPSAGGAVELTAAVQGTVNATRWPYLGVDVAGGSPLFFISPRNTSERSLAELEASEASLAAELQAATARLDRLQQLIGVEATSRRQVEDAQTLVTSLQARLSAARRDLETVRSARGSGTGGEVVTVRAPFDGRIAAVRVSPGQTVEAGAPLARVVRTRPVWVEVALTPGDATRLSGNPAGLTLRASATEGPLSVSREDVRLVARAPEVDPANGTVRVILEIGRSVDQLQLGATVEAEILLADEVRGVVLPSPAVIDDGGVSVVYLQLGGESFARREVVVTLRQGDVVLVDGVAPGERVVTVGGAAIRRSELVSSGSVEGHVH